MAITSLGALAKSTDYDTQRTGAGYYGRIYPSPDTFRPYGQGLGVTTPNFVADEGNANAVMINYGASADSPREMTQVHLWVEALKTGYAVTGQYAQAHESRTWYPRNYVQDLVTITGWVANQNEYDNLVRFVQHSHLTALRSGASDDNWFKFVDFKLFRPKQSKNHTVHHLPDSGVHYSLIITDFDGGAERFQFAREFQMTCKVLDGHQDDPRPDPSTIDYVQIWGDPSLPTPVTIGTPSLPPTKSLKSGAISRIADLAFDAFNEVGAAVSDAAANAKNGPGPR